LWRASAWVTGISLRGHPSPSHLTLCCSSDSLFHPLLRLTMFSLMFDENGDLTTGDTCRFQYYSVPMSVTRSSVQCPVVFSLWPNYHALGGIILILCWIGCKPAVTLVSLLWFIISYVLANGNNISVCVVFSQVLYLCLYGNAVLVK
jgi:hypothetical protein